jgi:chromosome segregation ATPase
MPIPRDQLELLPPKDKKLLQEEDRDELRQAFSTIEYYDRELKRRTNELRQANQHVGDLQHESQRSKDFISDLQTLINFQQKLGANEDTFLRRPQDVQATPPGHRSEGDKRTLEIIDLLQHESQRSNHFINDLQNLINVHQHLGATEDTSARRPQYAQATTPGHHSEDEQPDRTLVTKQSTPQVPVPPSPKNIYQQLKEEYYRIRDDYSQSRTTIDNYDRQLKRRNAEIHKGNYFINQLQHESQRSKDIINSLQNELTNVHEQLVDARTLCEARGMKLIGLEVFSTKADTLSILEVGDRVNSLNDEIFQAAATLGDALVHKRHELSQNEWGAAVVASLEVVGEKMTRILIAQAEKPEREVNPLLVQVVLQIFMVEFCFSKVQSWYPGGSAIDQFLSAIYSKIRSTGNYRIDSKTRFFA